MCKRKAYILIGANGTGKGTLSDDYIQNTTKDIKKFSSGDFLRKAVADGTELGRQAAEYMNAGKFVPDDIIIKIVSEQLSHMKFDCILDGCIRSLKQAQEIYQDMKKAGIIPIVIHLDAPYEVIRERLCGRRVCTNKACGKVYSLTGPKAPRQEGLCDKCGSPLGRRKDDEPEIVEERFALFEKETKPALEYLCSDCLNYNRIDTTDLEIAKVQFYKVLDG